jgi:hypothetical protein
VSAMAATALIDTGAVVALLDHDDKGHQACLPSCGGKAPMHYSVMQDKSRQPSRWRIVFSTFGQTVERGSIKSKCPAVDTSK